MELTLETISAILIIVSALCVAGAYICLGTMRRAAAPDMRSDFDNDVDDALPSLTVIVYSEAGDDAIVDCVDTIMQQDYPDLQVVVVTRATASHTEMLAGRFADMPGVYVTFIPPGSHNLSERKLAITIGMKAARGEVVLTTASNIRPQSDKWLRRMMAPFANPRTELVLGFSRMDFNELSGPWRWYRQFDAMLTASQWIGYARAGKPYRGDAFNLAFRRDTFFAHKGYASNIYLHYGDDDLFVHEIADASNTRIVIDDAIVTTFWGHVADRVWDTRKSRYMFTARWLPRAPFARYGAMSLMNWTALAAATATAIVGAPLLWPAIGAPLIWLALQAAFIADYRNLASKLLAVRLWWAIPPFLLAHPFVTLFFRIKNRSVRKSNYTWQR